MLVHVYVYLVAEAHHVFVDRVVEHLFDKHIYAVVAVGAVAELAYVHARSALYVLFPVQRLYVRFAVCSSAAIDVAVGCLYIEYVVVVAHYTCLYSRKVN